MPRVLFSLFGLFFETRFRYEALTGLKLRVSYYIPTWSETHPVDQAVLELAEICLPLSPEGGN